LLVHSACVRGNSLERLHPLLRLVQELLQLLLRLGPLLAELQCLLQLLMPAMQAVKQVAVPANDTIVLLNEYRKKNLQIVPPGVDVLAGGLQLTGLRPIGVLGFRRQLGNQLEESLHTWLLVIDHFQLEVQVLELGFDHFVVGGRRQLVGQQFLQASKLLNLFQAFDYLPT
jgi:hypothetical protein